MTRSRKKAESLRHGPGNNPGDAPDHDEEAQPPRRPLNDPWKPWEALLYPFFGGSYHQKHYFDRKIRRMLDKPHRFRRLLIQLLAATAILLLLLAYRWLG